MVARGAILFTGVVLAGTFFNLYYFAACFLTILLLGIEDDLFHRVEYWLCFSAGVITAFYVLRPVWPKQAEKDVEGTPESTTTEPQ